LKEEVAMPVFTPSQGLTMLSPWEPNQRAFFLKTYKRDKNFRKFVNDKVDAYIEDPFVMVCADASQAEVRIAAELAHEQKLIDLYKTKQAFDESGDTSDHPELDVHMLTASGIFGVPINKVTSDQRKAAKSITFAVMYGATEFRIAFETGRSVKEAKKLLDNFWKSYPAIRTWVNKIIAEAVATGYVSTPTGRREAMPFLKGRREVLQCVIKGDSLYDKQDKIGKSLISKLMKEIGQARNFPVQSFTSDLMTTGAFYSVNQAKEEGIEIYLHTIVHDSVVISVRYSNLKRLLEILKYNFEHRLVEDFNLICPMQIEYEVGLNYDAQVKKLPYLIDALDFASLPQKMYDRWRQLKAKTVITSVRSDPTYLFQPEHGKCAILTSKEQKIAEISQRDFENSYAWYRKRWKITDGSLQLRKPTIEVAASSSKTKVEEEYIGRLQ
jgi:hypothetical protein